MGIESAKNNQKTFVKSQYYEIKRLLKEVVKAVLNGRFAILKKIFEKEETLVRVFSYEFCEFF